MTRPEVKPVTEPCHCGGLTVVYRTRRVQRRGHSIDKSYHRCENCHSRFVDIQPSHLDTAQPVSVFELLESFRNKNQKGT